MSAIEPSVLSAGRPLRGAGIALAWSGGKDSALALRALRSQGIAVIALLTTVTEGYDRVSMHGVRRVLLRAQAAAAGVSLVEVPIPPGCPNELYEERMALALAAPPLVEAEAIAFGDLFLEDVRRYREERLESTGRRAVFPLWGRETGELAHAFLAHGFEAVVCCLDPRRLDPAFAGRGYDARFLEELPEGVDPCGENGEFHTFVQAGPVFSRTVACRVGEVVEREGFVFCDLLPAG